MSNLSKFNNNQNINLLWDVLLDEICINTNNKSLVSNIKTVFESNIKLFTYNPNANIMNINKQFLSQVVLAVNRLFPNLKSNQEQYLKKINITNEELEEPYKIEDIHLSRQTEFEKSVEKKRLELENYMTPQKPKELDFSYGKMDGKITEMGSLISEKMIQRNLDMEPLNNGNYNDAETWLKSKETSIKNEKIISGDIKKKVSFGEHVSNSNNNNNINDNSNNNNNINDNNNDNNNINDNNNDNNNKNNINDDNNNINDDNSIINIFKKLKIRTPIVDEPNSNSKSNPELLFENNKYVEQKSLPLPEIKQEQPIKGPIIQSPSNIPIIPKNEIIKQLNDMNTKLDNLYEMITILTNYTQELITDKQKNEQKNEQNDDIDI